MEASLHTLYSDDTEVMQDCDVMIKEEPKMETDMELNPLEYVNVSIKSEAGDNCVLESSLKSKTEVWTEPHFGHHARPGSATFPRLDVAEPWAPLAPADADNCF